MVGSRDGKQWKALCNALSVFTLRPHMVLMSSQSAPIQPSLKRFGRGTLSAVILGGGLLAGCGVQHGVNQPVAARGHPQAETAYREPPQVTGAMRQPGGGLVLRGVSPPSSRVRLASPTGTLVSATSEPDGAWRARLPAAGSVRLFGVAAIENGRTMQAEGYLAVTPEGLVAQLRAGAGARVLAGPGPLRILSLDFDRKGGAVLSGGGRAGDAVSILADGALRGHGSVDADGHFTLALEEPLSEGPHRIEVVDGADRVGMSANVTAAAPLINEPFRANRVTEGWRIDWITPGGGAQTTLLLSPQSEEGQP